MVRERLVSFRGIQPLPKHTQLQVYNYTLRSLADVGYWRQALKRAGFLVIAGVLAELCLGIITSSGNHAFAQTLKPRADTASGRNLGTRVEKLTNQVDQIRGGTQRGANLFHSFSEFNVGKTRGVYFENPAGVTNILSRVTGNDPSNILGTLGVGEPGKLGTANLFLINPHGVIFGSKARLDVKGSFVATTASAIQFNNQGFFSASVPNSPGLLTVNPSAFLFNQVAAQPSNSIESKGSLSVPKNRSLLLVGGKVSPNKDSTGKILISGGLQAPDGRVELGGVAGLGEVGLSIDQNNLSLNFPNDVTRADVSLKRASVNVVAAGGGSIAINAQNLDVLEGSTLSAGIENSSGSVNRQAGDITIDATGEVKVDNSFIFNRLEFAPQGSSGNIRIKSESLYLTNAQLDAGSSFGQVGDPGEIFLQADDSVSINNSFVSSVASPEGDGSSIHIKTKSLSLSKAGLSTSTFGEGNAGEVLLDANKSISLENSQILATADQRAKGNGGDIRILQTGSLSLLKSEIRSSTAGQGRAGNVIIEAGRVAVEDRSEIAVESVIGTGNAGNLQVTAQFILLNQGKLTATTESGKGGGNITLQKLNLLLLNRNSKISTDARGNGKGGNITIGTDLLASLKDSDITANAFEGRGGNIQITTRGLFRSPDSEITAKSERGIDGVVEFNTPDVDPDEQVVDLPEEVVDVGGLVVQSCPAGRGDIARGSSEFVVTGRGGLPPTPSEALKSDSALVDLGTTIVSATEQSSASKRLSPVIFGRELGLTRGAATPEELPRRVEGRTENRSSPAVFASSTHSTSTPTMEAQGWVVGPNGEVVLTAQAPAVIPDNSELISVACHGS